jgi:hypothetical protein
MLQLTIGLLLKKDAELFARTGVRRCWIITNMNDLFTDFKNKDRWGLVKDRPLRSFDFTTMYTNFPQNTIIENVCTAFKEAQDYERTLMGAKGDVAMTLNWPEQKLRDFVDFVVRNTFIGNDSNNIKHQKIGTNAGTELANLCLYPKEAGKVDRLLIEDRIEETKAEADNKRFVDDFLGLGTVPPSQEKYGGLEYGEITRPSGAVDYLGAKLSRNSQGRLQMSVYDNFVEWPFAR